MSKPELFTQPIPKATIKRLADEGFGDMIKFVVDLERQTICAGGGMHADAEAILLANGSAQSSLWGANYYWQDGTDGRYEYTSMINIRPRDGNRRILIESPDIRRRVRELAVHFFETHS